MDMGDVKAEGREEVVVMVVECGEVWYTRTICGKSMREKCTPQLYFLWLVRINMYFFSRKQTIGELFSRDDSRQESCHHFNKRPAATP